MKFKNWLWAMYVMVAAFVSLGTSNASADFVNPFVPFWRGAANTDFYGWEHFTSAFGGPNLPDYPSTEPGAALFNFGPGATLDGGNIHAVNSPLSITVYAGLTAPVDQIVVNIATMGSVLSGSTVRLTLADNAGHSVTLAPTLFEMRSDEPGPGGEGRIQTRAYKWQVSGVEFGPIRFQLDFASYTGGINLNTVSTDIHYIPAPGVFALSGIALVLGARRRRRS